MLGFGLVLSKRKLHLAGFGLRGFEGRGLMVLNRRMVT